MMSPFKANEKCSHFKALELLLEGKSTNNYSLYSELKILKRLNSNLRSFGYFTLVRNFCGGD